VLKGFEEIVSVIRSSRSLDGEISGIRRELGTLFPFGMAVDTAIGSSAGTRAACSDIDANLAVLRLTSSRRGAEEITAVVSKSKAPIAVEMAEYARHCLGSPKFTPEQVADAWIDLCAELQRLRGLKPRLQVVSRVSDLIERSGAVNWAHRLRVEVVEGNGDPLVPVDWRETWTWARLHGHLKEIDGRARIKALTAERAERLALLQELHVRLADIPSVTPVAPTALPETPGTNAYLVLRREWEQRPGDRQVESPVQGEASNDSILPEVNILRAWQPHGPREPL